jgi:phage recombination protein Bet
VATDEGLAHPNTGVVVVPFHRGPLTITADQQKPTAAQLSALEAIGITIGGRDGFTEGAVMLLFQVAAATGLDPFKRQIWLIRTWNLQDDGSRKLEYAVMVGIHTMAGLARATNEHRGMEGPEFCLDPDEDIWVKTWPRRGEYPTAARFRVHREGVPDEATPWAVVYWDEIVPMVHQFVPGPDGRKIRDTSLPMMPHPRWQRSPITMLGKCAHAAALRATFPDAIGALYIGEEMERAQQEAADEDAAFRQAQTRGDDRDRVRDIRHLLEAGRRGGPEATADGIVVGTVPDSPPGKAGLLADEAMRTAHQARVAAEARVKGRTGPAWEKAPADEQAAYLWAEIQEWSTVLDVPFSEWTTPLEPIFGAVAGWGVKQLYPIAAQLRPTVVQALRQAGRQVEATALAQVGTEVIAPLPYLLGQLEDEDDEESLAAAGAA